MPLTCRLPRSCKIMGKGGKGKDSPAPKKHRSRSSREYSKRRASPRERKAGQYVRYSKDTTGPPRSQKSTGWPDQMQPCRLRLLSPVQGLLRMTSPATSTRPPKSRMNRLWLFGGTKSKPRLPGNTQAPEEKVVPVSEADKEPASGARASKERASGSTQPMQVDEP